MNPFTVKINVGEEVNTLTEATGITEEQLKEANDTFNKINAELIEGKILDKGTLIKEISEKLSQEQVLVIVTGLLIEVLEMKNNHIARMMAIMGQSED